MPLGSKHLPVLAASEPQSTYQYPPAHSELLAAGQTFALYDRAGCSSSECLPRRLTAVIQVADLSPGRQTALLSNIAAASWVRAFVKGSGGESWQDAATRALAEAAHGHAGGDPESWLKIAAAPLSSLLLAGRTNAQNCSAGNKQVAELEPQCACSVELPKLFTPAVFSVQQVPLLMVDITFRDDVPEESVQAVRSAVSQLIPSATDLGVEVCMSEPKMSISDGAHGCDGAPALPPALPLQPAPPPAACAPLWQVQLYTGACTRRALSSGSVPVPVAPPDGNAEVHMTMRSIDLFRSTCRNAFPGFPVGWEHGFCARFSAYVCAAGAPQVLRIELAAAGPTAAPAALLVNGSVAATAESAADVADSGNIAAWAAEHGSDAIVALPRGCHHVEVLLDDPIEGDKLALGNATMVCFKCTAARAQHG